MDEIQQGLNGALKVLAASGRLSVISFHSLEDRLVKRFMKEKSKGQSYPAGLPITQAEIDASKSLNLIGKAIKPSQHEIDNNIRARSSVLRIGEKR